MCLLKINNIIESTSAFLTYRANPAAFEVIGRFFPLVEASLDTEEKASGAGPMFRVLMAERAAPVEQICYESAGFWFSKLCIASLMLAAWGNAFRGVPKGLYSFFS